MTDIEIIQKNYSFIKINAEPHILKEISEDFTFYADNYFHSPKFKKHLWDGKIRLFDQRTRLLYTGLKSKLDQWAKDHGYTTNIEWPCNALNPVAIKDWVNSLFSTNSFEVRDYQHDLIIRALEQQRGTVVSPTGSGKSLIIWILCRYYSKKTLIICPTTNLVEQMYNDFKEYGENVEKTCLKIWAGIDPNTDKNIVISTWQSLINLPSEYFEQFGVVICDEAHGAQAKSITTIMNNCVNAFARFGFTATTSNDVQIHELMLEGLFGVKIEGETTAELIEKKYLANLNIICIILEYPESQRKIMKKKEFQDEVDYLMQHPQRQNFVNNLVLSLKGSSFVLCRLIEKQLKLLYQKVVQKKGKNCQVVYGATEVEEREAIRKLANINDELTVVASYGVFSGGVNIPNLKNVVFASPYKSKIKVMQSIGRSLRRTEQKDTATVYDIVDDLTSGGWTNYSMRHFYSRLKIYNTELLSYKIIRVPLKDPAIEKTKLL